MTSKLALHIDEHSQHTESSASGLSSRYDELSNKYEDLVSKNTDLNTQNNNLRSDVDMLKALVVKQSNEIGDLKSGRLFDLQTRSMEENVIFHNVVESRGENCEEKVRGILKSKPFGGVIDIEKIHRIGNYIPSASHPRPIVAKLGLYKQCTTLLQFQSTLPKRRKKI